jgi:hypothetical protein
METTAALFSQAELCEAAGIDRETANNWIKRGLLETSTLGGRKLRGRRLFSMLEICKAHLMNETIKCLAIPASDAAEIADRAIAEFVKTEKLARIDDGQEPTFALALVSRHREQWVTDLRRGGKALFSEKESREARHPLAILPIAQAFVAIHQQCVKFLHADRRVRRGFRIPVARR